MITLKNWNKLQMEVVHFVQLIWQDDDFIRKITKLVRCELSKEQWNKTVAEYSDREIDKIVIQNVDGQLHGWVYFREDE